MWALKYLSLLPNTRKLLRIRIPPLKLPGTNNWFKDAPRGRLLVESSLQRAVSEGFAPVGVQPRSHRISM
jgi:hypothetical protein